MNTTHGSKLGQESVVEGRLVEPWLGPQSLSYSPCTETPLWQAQPEKPWNINTCRQQYTYPYHSIYTNILPHFHTCTPELMKVLNHASQG